MMKEENTDCDLFKEYLERSIKRLKVQEQKDIEVEEDYKLRRKMGQAYLIVFALVICFIFTLSILKLCGVL